MKLKRIKIALAVLTLCIIGGCDAKTVTVEKGREAVKEVVTQPFNQLDSAKDSLKKSEDKQKATLEQANKEIN